MDAPDGLLEVGHIRRAHGISGTVIVELGTHRTDRLDCGSRLHARGGWLTVQHAQRYQDRWLVTFAELDSREAAQRYTNVPLLAEPVDDPDAMWIHDLIGSTVVEVDGTRRGRCVSVVANPASDLLELDSGALVPAAFVVDQAAGPGGRTVTIDPPAGLFDDANASESPS
jgi:16S rRNA processing protein RimM